MERIVIVDYGMGNLRSVQKKIENIGGKGILSSDKEEISNAAKIILPGVGHFKSAVNKLKEKGLWDILNKKALVNKTPILGICLGMQLMAKHSEEGDVDGFGWFDATVVKFQVSDKLKFKIPHIGWNQTIVKRENDLLKGIEEDANYYFVHSYYIKCNDQKDILANTIYDCEFTSVIQKENIYGVQFHPEKSHETGESLLRNFINL